MMWHLIQFSYRPDGETAGKTCMQVRRPGGAGHRSLVCIVLALTLSADTPSPAGPLIWTCGGEELRS